MIIKSMIIFFLILIASFPVQSSENKIQIPTIDGDTIEAIISSPDENNKHPAIVYMHGGAVRERGNPVYGPNNEFLYDITDKIRDMTSLGLVILAPLRKTPSVCCNGDDAIKEGMKWVDDEFPFPRITLEENGYYRFWGHGKRVA